MTDKEIILECPHCKGSFIVLKSQLNCKFTPLENGKNLQIYKDSLKNYKVN